MHGTDRAFRARLARAAGAVALSAAVLFVAFFPGGDGNSVPPATTLPRAGDTATASSSPCLGVAVGSQYHGHVADAGGGASAPPLANQSVVLSYRYTQTYHASAGGLTQYVCVAAQVDATTDARGAFSATAQVPGPFCSKPYGCWNYTGPFGPVAFALGNGSVPAGYYLDSNVSNGSVTLTRVLALNATVLAPAGFTTVSLFAPSAIRAEAVSGLGTPSPANLTYAWSLAGTGWRSLSATDRAVLTVEALSTNYVATARVWVNGTFQGATLHAPPVAVLLTAAATSIATGQVHPTSVDVGIPAQFTWTGTGSAGYNYSATLSPGLGLAPVPASCLNRSVAGGLLQFDCAATYSYATPGSAQPFGTLANPYSSANYSFAPMTISAGLVVSLAPDPTTTYPGLPAIFHVALGAGTGTTPYGPACLTDGIGHTECQNDSFGPPWTFSVPYPNVGHFTAVVTVADSGGTNYTASVPVAVVARPTLGAIALSPSQVTEGRSVYAVADYEGGGLSASYWWNASVRGLTTNLGGGELPSDGPVALSLHPAWLGLGMVNLTVVDALGTRLAVSTRLNVVSANATDILRSGAPNATIAAGSAVALTFEVRDAVQDPVAPYYGAFEMIASTPGAGLTWVNASVTGPVSVSNGSYAIPPSNWISGFLNLTFTTSLAGPVNLSFSAPAGIVGPPMLRLTVGPDVRAERLVNPDVVRSGARSNATLYEISDRFGNPVPGGWVDVRSVFGPTKADVDSPIRLVDGASWVWVNYSAFGSGSGIVLVFSQANRSLLGPIVVPALPGPSFDPVVYGLLAGLLAAAFAGAVVLARRRRPDPAEGPEPEEAVAVEEGLKRLAEGRAHVLDRVPTDPPVDLDHIAAGWKGVPPDAAELAEWVSSLVSEGVLKASIGPGGRPMFVRVAPGAPAPAPRIEVDALALEAALARQQVEASAPEDRDDDAPDGTPD